MKKRSNVVGGKYKNPGGRLTQKRIYAQRNLDDISEKLQNLLRRQRALQAAIDAPMGEKYHRNQELGKIYLTADGEWTNEGTYKYYQSKNTGKLKKRHKLEDRLDDFKDKRREQIRLAQTERIPAASRKLETRRSSEANRTNRIKSLQESSARARARKLAAERKKRHLSGGR